MATLDDPLPPWPADGRFEGLCDFQAAVRQLLLTATARGARQMHWISPGFDAWPLEDTEVLQALAAWARPGHRRLHWVGRDFESLRRSQPRLVTWRQQWGHVVSCRQPVEEDAAHLPVALMVGDEVLLMLQDERHWRGRISSEARDLAAWRERVDAILQRSSETFPVTTLGI